MRRLARDQLSPVLKSTDSEASRHDEVSQSNARELARTVQLEKNILFLNKQHEDILGELHKEIEKLRIENRGKQSS